MTCRRGDVVRWVLPGGGGWGDPLERDPERVLRDVRNELVSPGGGGARLRGGGRHRAVGGGRGGDGRTPCRAPGGTGPPTLHPSSRGVTSHGRGDGRDCRRGLRCHGNSGIASRQRSRPDALVAIGQGRRGACRWRESDRERSHRCCVPPAGGGRRGGARAGENDVLILALPAYGHKGGHGRDRTPCPRRSARHHLVPCLARSHLPDAIAWPGAVSRHRSRHGARPPSPPVACRGARSESIPCAGSSICAPFPTAGRRKGWRSVSASSATDSSRATGCSRFHSPTSTRRTTWASPSAT